MKVRWSECKVQLKQKDNNCSSVCIIHSEPEDASRSYFGITFTVIVVIILTIAIVTVAMAIVIFIYNRFGIVPFRSLLKHYSFNCIGRMKDDVVHMCNTVSI